MMLGFAPISSGPIGAVPTAFAPAAVQPPSISSGGALGFGAVGAAPLATVPTFPPPDVAFIVSVVEAADATAVADAAVAPATIVIGIGGGYRAEPLPPLVTGIGYGVLPPLEGEAHGEVGPASKDGDDFELALLDLLLVA